MLRIEADSHVDNRNLIGAGCLEAALSLLQDAAAIDFGGRHSFADGVLIIHQQQRKPIHDSLLVYPSFREPRSIFRISPVSSPRSGAGRVSPASPSKRQIGA